MRTVSTAIWDAWNSGGPFIGDAAASHSRVTVEPGWFLTRSGSIVGTYKKGPIRWFQSEANDQVEVEVPNIKRISIDRSIDTDAATCTITLANQWMDENLVLGSVDDLGNPGYFTFDRGSAIEAQARWGHEANEWSDVLVLNALLRTYQGYGGKSKTVADAIADDNIVTTGLWLVDQIRINAKGELELGCRDMARLLVDQRLYTPLVPGTEHPIRRCRWIQHSEFIQHQPQLAQSQDRHYSYGNCVGPSVASASDAYYGFNGSVYGHRPTHGLDANTGSFWLSVGNGSQTAPFAWEWLEVCVGGEEMDAVYIDPMIPDGGTYDVYISVWEGSGWVDGSGGAVINYQTGGIGIYTGANTARIPWVWHGGVSGPTEIRLPRKYAAGKYRITLTTLRNFYASSRIGSASFPWRAGIRETRPRLAGYVVPGWLEHREWQEDGNYFDYTDIIRDLLLWSGWWLFSPVVTGAPAVFGNLETTGAWAERGCLDEAFFEKKPVVEAINDIKEIVGYLFWVDEDGAAHFESENIWAAGNFNELGQHTTFIPEIDEALQLTDYAVVASADALRSEIIISTDDPEQETFATTVTTRFRPATGDLLRGIERPAMWLNDMFTDAAEQRIMAELVAMRIFFSIRVGNVSCAANPAIQINDQVRIFERTTGETNIHYVRSVQTEHDLESGAYTMTLTTHWLGSDNDWVITASNIPGDESSVSRPKWVLSDALASFLRLHNSRSIAVSRHLV